VSLWRCLGDAVDDVMVSKMECNRSVYPGGAGQGGFKGFSIHEPRLLSWSRQFMEEKDGKSSLMISPVGSDFSAFVSASVVEMEELA